MTALLEIHDLTVEFGRRRRRAVAGLDLSLGPGERLGLIGQSGSGKSVTALAVMGLLPETARVAGSVRWDGLELLGRSDRELSRLRGRDLAIVFQEPMTALDPTMRVGRQVAEVIKLHPDAAGGSGPVGPVTPVGSVVPAGLVGSAGSVVPAGSVGGSGSVVPAGAVGESGSVGGSGSVVSAGAVGESGLVGGSGSVVSSGAIVSSGSGLARRQARTRARVVESLGQVGLPDPAAVAEAFPHQLSGGQRQRAMLAMALVNRPRLVICDEPTTALDVTVQAQILELLDRQLTLTGAACLFISHDLAVVAQVCRRVAVMLDGRLVEAGPVEAVLRHPAHPYTRGLIAAARLDRAQPGSRLPTLGEDWRTDNSDLSRSGRADGSCSDTTGPPLEDAGVPLGDGLDPIRSDPAGPPSADAGGPLGDGLDPIRSDPADPPSAGAPGDSEERP